MRPRNPAPTPVFVAGVALTVPEHRGEFAARCAGPWGLGIALCVVGCEGLEPSESSINGHMAATTKELYVGPRVVVRIVVNVMTVGRPRFAAFAFPQHKPPLNTFALRGAPRIGTLPSVMLIEYGARRRSTVRSRFALSSDPPKEVLTSRATRSDPLRKNASTVWVETRTGAIRATNTHRYKCSVSGVSLPAKLDAAWPTKTENPE